MIDRRRTRSHRNAIIESLETRRLLSAAVMGPQLAPNVSNAVVIKPFTATQPSVALVNPANGATSIYINTAVACDLNLPNGALEPSTVNNTTVKLVKTSDSSSVAATVNTTGGGDAIVLQPTADLAANTQYTFTITAGVKDVTGASFVPFTSTFTTGTLGGTTNTSIAFSQVALSNAQSTQGDGFTCVRIGPDGMLYASTEEGRLLRWTINSDGTLGTPTVSTVIQTTEGTNRLITGFAFDPNFLTNHRLWVSHTFYALSAATTGVDLTGKISVISGANMDVDQDVVTGLPRSISDHVTNQPVFKPGTNLLFFGQAAENAFGAPDQTWAYRPDHELSAAILVLDTTKVTPGSPVDARTPDVGGTYDPYAANAPLTIYATGVRNAYQIMFDSSGTLWAVVNGSSLGGNSPAYDSSDSNQVNGDRIDTGQPYAGPNVPALTNIQETEDDFLDKIVQGGYYGHPDPARGEFVLDAGNPTSATGISGEVFTEYPSGTNPDVNYRGLPQYDGGHDIYDWGPHHSPDGILQYSGSAFNGALNGDLMIADYSAGSDIAVVKLDSNDNVASVDHSISGLTGLTNPVNLIEDTTNGNIYVSELAANGTPRLLLLKPSQTAPSAPTGLQSTASAAGIALSWSASTGATSYHIERAVGVNGTFTEIGTATGTTYTDNTAAAGTIYAYRVRAQSASGYSDYSATVYNSLTNASLAAPTNLQAVASAGQVALSWNASSGATSYRVERMGPQDSGFVEVATGLTTPAYTDASVTAGATYQYRVRAENTGGLSAYSATASATLPGSTGSGLDIVIGKTAAKTVRFMDSGGASTIITLAGLGTATVHFSGSTFNQTTTKAGITVTGISLHVDSITGAGTGANSVLTINAHGGSGMIDVGQISSDGAFKTITGNTTVLTGNLSVPSTVGTLTLGSIDNVTLSAASINNLKLLHDSSLTLNVGAAKTISVAGALTNSTLNLSAAGIIDLATLTTRSMTSTLVDAAGSLGNLSLGSMDNSEVYAGITTLPSGQLLPAVTSDIVAPSSIKSVKLRAGKSAAAFVNSAVAAAELGNISLGVVQWSNAGAAFGVAAHTINALTVTDATIRKSVTVHKLADNTTFTVALAAKGINPQDFTARIL
jgi:glucose/arabinose dehydrogenase